MVTWFIASAAREASIVDPEPNRQFTVFLGGRVRIHVQVKAVLIRALVLKEMSSKTWFWAQCGAYLVASRSPQQLQPLASFPTQFTNRGAA